MDCSPETINRDWGSPDWELCVGDCTEVVVGSPADTIAAVRQMPISDIHMGSRRRWLSETLALMDIFILLILPLIKEANKSVNRATHIR